MFEGLTPEQIALIAASLGMPKLLIKLLDVIQQGTGTISEPYFNRKKAEALADGKTYEIKKLTEQFVESQNLLPSIEYKEGQLSILSKSENELNLQQRCEHRFEFQQAKKQLNVENVTANAVEELLNDPEVENYTNNESVDADWTTRFFETVENVSDEEMQLLWGRILKGEVKHPKSFSLKTLEILKNMTKEEAKLFTQFCNCAIESIEANILFIPKINGFDTLSNRFFDISYDKYLALCEIGLINNDDTTQIKYGELKKGNNLTFRLANKVIIINFLEDVSGGKFPIIKFTKSGTELFKLLAIDFNIHLISYLVTGFSDKKIETFFGEIIGIKDGLLTYKELNKIT